MDVVYGGTRQSCLPGRNDGCSPGDRELYLVSRKRPAGSRLCLIQGNVFKHYSCM